LISEQQQSGKSIAGFCRERGLREWQFQEWISLSGQQIEIRLKGGRSLVVGSGFDAQHLWALLAVLESEA